MIEKINEKPCSVIVLPLNSRRNKNETQFKQRENSILDKGTHNSQPAMTEPTFCVKRNSQYFKNRFVCVSVCGRVMLKECLMKCHMESFAVNTSQITFR